MRTALVIAALLACIHPVSADTVRFDFETGDAQGWAVMEGMFDKIVNSREFRRNTPSIRYNQQGKYYLNTLEKQDGGCDDGMMGVIESPVILLSSPRIEFLIGGGGHSDTYVALCTEDGEEVLKARGANSEEMRRVVWDARGLVGKRVFMSVVDRNPGSWGHVTLDDVVMQGRIDNAATERVRAGYAERAARIAAGQERKRRERLAQLTSHENLFDRGRTTIYRGDNLSAIAFTVGGIGAGCIQMDGKARPAAWQIFNNHRSASLPDTFFAVRARAAGGKAVVRALQTEAAGPFAAVKSLSFRGEYPIANYDFQDPALPVKVSMETFSPFVPMNARDSAIPCAVYALTAENTSTTPVEVSFLASQQNAVGFTGQEDPKGRKHAEYGRNSNQVIPAPNGLILHMTAAASRDCAGWGDMALLAVGGEAQATAAWDDVAALSSKFAETGTVTGPQKAGPSPDGETLDGAVAVPFELKPGEKKTITFALCWYFPNAPHGAGEWGGKGSMYQNWWPSALHVAQEMSKRLPELTGQTHRFHDTFYASNLPHWLLDRITSQVAILRSKTVFWTRDGYFGGWEGCSSAQGCCAGNCSHVWHYAQAHARLFPEIGRLMRQQELDHETAEGMVPHRQLPNCGPATDGQLGTILESYREYLTSSHKSWLDKYWPKVKGAMDYVIKTWDAEEDGVLSGRQWNTLDEALSGSSSWLGSLYLAALEASEKMAAVEGDSVSAQRYSAIRGRGMKTQDETLFNGEYYIQIPGAEPIKDYNDGCHIDQVLGQWWANQLGLGRVYPHDRVQTALKSLMKYNFKAAFRGITQVPRQFVADEDAGMQMITWPKGGRPAPEHQMYYADEVMSGFEYSAAAEMIHEGLLEEGFTIYKAAHDRYDGCLRTGLVGNDNGNWGYTGNPFGDDECGKYYARAMSMWGALIACQGFIYDGPAGLIGFKPVWKPDDHVSFFTSAEGYGLFTQKRASGKQTDRIEVRHGKLDVKSLVFELAPDMKPSKVDVKVAGKSVEAQHSIENGVLTVGLPSRMTLNDGQAVEVTIS